MDCHRRADLATNTTPSLQGRVAGDVQAVEYTDHHTGGDREQRPTRIANKIADQFLEFVKKTHEDTIASSVGYYEEQRDAAEASLAAVREELAELKQTANLVALQNEVERLASQVTSYLTQQV